ncbi:HAD family phosphatase [Candidatus Saccharibacteria bacterium]|nr:HAD family phosphatase [Candidatus Saccharibacteria bacterium]
MIKAIIFDCFDVVLSDGFEAAYAKFGGDSTKDREFLHQLIQDVSSGKIDGSSSIIALRLGITEAEWREANFAGYVINTPLLDYALELKKTYKLAMLSNVGKGGLKRFFDPGFLERYFDPVVESAAIGYAKPEARAYEIVAGMLGVRLDECVFIDDRQEYVDGATAVGMQAVLYKSVSQLRDDINNILEEGDENGK